MPKTPLLSRVRAFFTRTMTWASDLLAAPTEAVKRLGVSYRSRRVTNPWAVSQLGLMAQSPTIYAALHDRCLGMQVYPLRVHLVTPGGEVLDTIDPMKERWAADLLRLLQRPDPADLDRVFPRTPGELMLAQLMADLLMTGTAYVRFQQSDAGTVTGLYRLHPGVTAIEYKDGERRFVYRPTGGVKQTFRDEEVCVLRWLSASADLDSEQGIGAGAPLQKITQAAVQALDRTVTAIAQGGVDLLVEPRDDVAGAMLMDQAQREVIVAAYEEALSKPDSRILAGAGNFKLTEMGFKPADLRGPEAQAAAAKDQLMAIGVVPVAVGADSTSYATAAAQLRVQFGWDFKLATWIEIFLFRPLAQHFAKMSGDPRWAARSSYVTCAWDLSEHPGALAARSEGVDRMVKIQNAGWTGEQAANAEHLNLPKPLGTPMMAVGPYGVPGNAPAAAPAQLGGNPGDAVGGGRTLGDLFQGCSHQGCSHQLARVGDDQVAPDLEEQRRADLWRAIEDGRAESDASLRTGARAALDAEREAYDQALQKILADAWDGTSYSTPDWSALPAANPDRYTEALGPAWLSTWESATATAVPDGLGVPVPTSSPSTLDGLADSSAKMAETTRAAVLAHAQAAVEAGFPPAEVRAQVSGGPMFSPERDLLISRTETVRAQSTGTNARYQSAEDAGVEMEIEWLAAPGARATHRGVDRVRVKVGGTWTFSSGVVTTGPGLSGEAKEDANCRCATRPVVRAKPAPSSV